MEEVKSGDVLVISIQPGGSRVAWASSSSIYLRDASSQRILHTSTSFKQVTSLRWIQVDGIWCVLAGYDNGVVACFGLGGQVMFAQILHHDTVANLDTLVSRASFQRHARDIVVLYSAVIVLLDGTSFDNLCRASLGPSLSSSTASSPVDSPISPSFTEPGQRISLKYTKWHIRGASALCGSISCRHLERSLIPGQSSAGDLQMVLVGSNPIISYCVLKNSHSDISVIGLGIAVAKKVTNAVFSFARNLLIGGADDTAEDTSSSMISTDENVDNRIAMKMATETADKCRLSDPTRRIVSIIADPRQRFAATCDSFGRVMLIDLLQLVVIRMWKGYRDAQCSFVIPRSDGSHLGTYLVIYAPRRGLLEIWRLTHGPRVAAFNIGEGCRLVPIECPPHSYILRNDGSIVEVGLSADFSIDQLQDYFNPGLSQVKNLRQIDDILQSYAFEHSCTGACDREQSSELRQDFMDLMREAVDFHERELSSLMDSILSLLSKHCNCAAFYLDILLLLEKRLITPERSSPHVCVSRILHRKKVLNVFEAYSSSGIGESISSIGVKEFSDMVAIQEGIDSLSLRFSHFLFDPLLSCSSSVHFPIVEFASSLEIEGHRLTELFLLWFGNVSLDALDFEPSTSGCHEDMSIWLNEEDLTLFENSLSAFIRRCFPYRSKFSSSIQKWSLSSSKPSKALLMCRICHRLQLSSSCNWSRLVCKLERFSAFLRCFDVGQKLLVHNLSISDLDRGLTLEHVLAQHALKAYSSADQVLACFSENAPEDEHKRSTLIHKVLSQLNLNRTGTVLELAQLLLDRLDRSKPNFSSELDICFQFVEAIGPCPEIIAFCVHVWSLLVRPILDSFQQAAGDYFLSLEEHRRAPLEIGLRIVGVVRKSSSFTQAHRKSFDEDYTSDDEEAVNKEELETEINSGSMISSESNADSEAPWLWVWKCRYPDVVLIAREPMLKAHEIACRCCLTMLDTESLIPLASLVPDYQSEFIVSMASKATSPLAALDDAEEADRFDRVRKEFFLNAMIKCPALQESIIGLCNQLGLKSDRLRAALVTMLYRNGEDDAAQTHFAVVSDDAKAALSIELIGIARDRLVDAVAILVAGAKSRSRISSSSCKRILAALPAQAVVELSKKSRRQVHGRSSKKRSKARLELLPVIQIYNLYSVLVQHVPEASSERAKLLELASVAQTLMTALRDIDNQESCADTASS